MPLALINPSDPASDTTTTTFTAIFYQLARHPEEVEKLRAELAPFVDEREPFGDFSDDKISHLGHLNGVINEALRLYPAVPSAMDRVTPPEGISVDGVFIPGNTTVICPGYAIGRCKSNPTGGTANDRTNAD